MDSYYDDWVEARVWILLKCMYHVGIMFYL